TGASEPPKDPDLLRIAQECAGLIEREVATLAALVNEFSQFVRFPTAKLLPTDTNTTVNQAVQVFAGRLDGITLKTSFEEHLPPVRADGPLLRSVIVNLIDNAAEASRTRPAAKSPSPPICARNPIPLKLRFPIRATAYPRRTRTSSSCRISRPR